MQHHYYYNYYNNYYKNNYYRYVIVADVVTRPVTTGLRQCNPGWHSILPSSAAPVGHELGRATCVLLVEVRPHHSALEPSALAESTIEDPVQICCSRV